MGQMPVKDHFGSHPPSSHSMVLPLQHPGFPLLNHASCSHIPSFPCAQRWCSPCCLKDRSLSLSPESPTLNLISSDLLAAVTTDPSVPPSHSLKISVLASLSLLSQNPCHDSWWFQSCINDIPTPQSPSLLISCPTCCVLSNVLEIHVSTKFLKFAGELGGCPVRESTQNTPNLKGSTSLL